MQYTQTQNAKMDWLFFALIVFFALVPLVFLAPRAAAQGCAMCYQNAAASGARGSAALRHGILILLLPALSLFSCVFVLIYRRRNATNSPNAEGS